MTAATSPDGGARRGVWLPAGPVGRLRRAVLRAGGAVGALAVAGRRGRVAVHDAAGVRGAHATPATRSSCCPSVAASTGCRRSCRSATRATARPRPTIAHARQSRADPLDGRFGLHPALAPLLPLLDRRHVRGRARGRPAQPHPVALRRHGGDGAGRPRPVAAHRLARPDGRPAAAAPGPSPATSIGSTTAAELVPRARRPSSHRLGRRVRLAGAGDSRRAGRWDAALRALHAGRASALGAPALATAATPSAPRPACRRRRTRPANGATYPDGRTRRRAARRGPADQGRASGCRSRAIDYGDWDMHVGPGAPPTTAGCATS